MTNGEKITRLPPTPKLPDYDNLVAHELASLMDMIEGSKFEDLKYDIKQKGILQKIMLYEGKILDGRNRYKAAKDIGLTLSAANFETFEGTYEQAEAAVISLNDQRRQMTGAQKLAVIQRMICKYPDDGDRAIARRCNMTSHSQVAKAREKMNELTPEQRKFEDHCKDFKKFYDWAPAVTDANDTRYSPGATQRERREVLAQTIHGRAASELSLERSGRFASTQTQTVIGANAIPEYPTQPLPRRYIRIC